MDCTNIESRHLQVLGKAVSTSLGATEDHRRAMHADDTGR
jgi:hypothetical protein